MSAVSAPVSYAANSVPPAPAPVVLAPVEITGSTAPVPNPAALASLVKSAFPRGLAKNAGIVVTDPSTGDVLLNDRGDAPRTPASTMKLLTAASVLTTLPANTTLVTRVVVEGTTLTLIGGGDTTLARTRPSMSGGATLAELAAGVAKQIGAAPVNLTFDSSFFTGPSTGPQWPSGMPPVSALSLAGDFSRNPAKKAAIAFSEELRRAGVTVSAPRRGAAPDGGTEIARAESPVITVMVEHMLTTSDNVLAESLAHIAGAEVTGEASFASGAQATIAAANSLGLELGPKAVIVDGSGLSGADAIPASALTELLAMVAAGNDQRLSAIATGLPVAGVTGTLADRYVRGVQRQAAGFVRAKTGTLRNVVALAGTVEDVDGRVLVFAVLANKVPSVAKARQAADEFASRLFECGCQS